MRIDKLQEDQLNLFFHYAQLENWDIEELHIRTLLKLHPNDFFIFFKDDALLGFVVALKESEEFGFISSVLVLKEFRSLGYGKEIFAFALEHLKGCQIALDSVLGQESFYEKFGFQSYFNVILYKFLKGSVTLNKSVYDVIDLTKELAAKELNDYTQLMMDSKETQYKAIINEDTISSYAFTFAYKDGYKVHIESEDINEAVALFFALITPYKEHTSIYLQASKLSPLLLALSEVLSMQEVSKFTRMYKSL